MTTAFVNEDGGAGKTTLPASISTILNDRGIKTLIIDLTPKCSITRLFLQNREFPREETLYDTLMNNGPIHVYDTDLENVKVAPGHPELLGVDELQVMMFRSKVEEIKADYDCIFIDTANNGILVDMAIAGSDNIVIVTKPSRDSIFGAGRAIDLVDKINQKHQINVEVLEIILNKYKPKKRISNQAWGELQTNEKFSKFFKEDHVIRYTDLVNTFQYMFKNVGTSYNHIDTIKTLNKITEDLFA